MRYMPALRFPVFGSRVTTQGSVMKRPASFGQHCRMGETGQGEVVPRDDFLASTGFDRPGEELAHLGEHGEHFDFVKEALRGFDVYEPANAVGDLVERVDVEGQTHTALGAELIDEKLRAGVAFDVLEQERGAAKTVFRAARFADAISDLGDFENGVGFSLDFAQFAGAVERGDPFA